jgi:hypothetical protein
MLVTFAMDELVIFAHLPASLGTLASEMKLAKALVFGHQPHDAGPDRALSTV